VNLTHKPRALGHTTITAAEEEEEEEEEGTAHPEVLLLHSGANL